MTLTNIIDAAARRTTLAQRLAPGCSYGGALDRLADMVVEFFAARDAFDAAGERLDDRTAYDPSAQALADLRAAQTRLELAEVALRAAVSDSSNNVEL